MQHDSTFSHAAYSLTKPAMLPGGEELFAGQSWHALSVAAPKAAENLPPGHRWHAVDPVLLLKEPGGQLVQFVPLRKHPALHTQDVPTHGEHECDLERHRYAKLRATRQIRFNLFLFMCAALLERKSGDAENFFGCGSSAVWLDR